MNHWIKRRKRDKLRLKIAIITAKRNQVSDMTDRLERFPLSYVNRLEKYVGELAKLQYKLDRLLK